MAAKLAVKHSTWSAWESGRNRPDDMVAFAKRVQLAVGVPAWWLLGLDSPEPGGLPRLDSNQQPSD